MVYPAYYHAAINALIQGDEAPARRTLANSIRAYRRIGNRDAARALFNHAAHIGWPIKLRPNGRYC